MGEPSFLGIKLIDVALVVLWAMIWYSIGEIVGRSRRTVKGEEESGRN